MPMPEPMPDRGGRFLRDPESGALSPLPPETDPARSAAAVVPAAVVEVVEDRTATDPAPVEDPPNRKRK